MNGQQFSRFPFLLFLLYDYFYNIGRVSPSKIGKVLQLSFSFQGHYRELYISKRPNLLYLYSFGLFQLEMALIYFYLQQTLFFLNFFTIYLFLAILELIPQYFTLLFITFFINLSDSHLTTAFFMKCSYLHSNPYLLNGNNANSKQSLLQLQLVLVDVNNCSQSHSFLTSTKSTQYQKTILTILIDLYRQNTYQSENIWKQLLFLGLLSMGKLECLALHQWSQIQPHSSFVYIIDCSNYQYNRDDNKSQQSINLKQTNKQVSCIWIIAKYHLQHLSTQSFLIQIAFNLSEQNTIQCLQKDL